MSFYVKLKARDDSEATHWGVDLERAKEASRAQIGDQVQLARRNSNSDNSNRVTWSVRVLGRSRAKIEETAPAKITEDFAEKRLPHWSPEERASFKEKTNRLRSAIGSNEPERSR